MNARDSLFLDCFFDVLLLSIVVIFFFSSSISVFNSFFKTLVSEIVEIGSSDTPYLLSI